MTSGETSRRDVIKAVAGVTAAGLMSNLATGAPPRSFIDILRFPDFVRIVNGKGEPVDLNGSGGIWSGPNCQIKVVPFHTHLEVILQGGGEVSRIQLRWEGDLGAVTHIMGDHWERSYADMEWRGHAPNRTMPWFFLASDGKRTDAYGVKTGANSMCFWNADTQGISLWMDVRNGGNPVQLGSRELVLAEVVCRRGHDDESAFQAARIFCKQMCSKPRLPDHAVYGTNDWNYAYGNNSADLIASVGELVSNLSPNTSNRPYSVIDEGWAMGPYNGHFGYGPWEGNPRFGDMGKFADRLKGMGIRPGIWFRPLTPLDGMPESLRHERGKRYLDPTLPEVIDHVQAHIRKFTGWGYQMIKHDFTSWDVFGKWGFQMGNSVTDDGWSLHDKSRTNAEILKGLYTAIREAAGEALLIGCNTVGHLSAGTHELQRIGDDTSGRNWDRNRRMGVNTLAFRAPHHDNFYICDPDIVSITDRIPFDLTSQWLQLVSQSGMGLFVAIQPEFLKKRHKAAMSEALQIASHKQPVAEPLDWMTNMCPERWKLRGKTQAFEWMPPSGAYPFGD